MPVAVRVPLWAEVCVGEEKEAALPLCVIVRSWVGFLRLFF